MRLFEAMKISATGMTAERLRMDLIANNLANINTTRTAEGGPYRRQTAIFSEIMGRVRDKSGNGVKVVGISRDSTPPQLVHDPGHPDADENGYVARPNINVVNEMVDMITATRAYEANVTAVNAFKGMFLKALEIGRG
ncbi:MAG: flagellar basal body rod protein FlgC [Dethiobacter sp.]|jgi:flagellar basal-body rod protein FlgC|nr:MAG: flagellar basal body rod protein FlgC [Dethiobacter sp.]